MSRTGVGDVTAIYIIHLPGPTCRPYGFSFVRFANHYAASHRRGLLLPTSQVPWSVFGTPVSPAKTAEPIEMLYEGRREDPGNHTLDMGGAHWCYQSTHAVRKAATIYL